MHFLYLDYRQALTCCESGHPFPTEKPTDDSVTMEHQAPGLHSTFACLHMVADGSSQRLLR